jgi:hypothetical protein
MKLLKFSLSSLLFISATMLLSANETIFNGKNLTGWSAEDMSYWSVQNGGIVGTKGDQKIPGNQFLWYDRKVQDFKLTLKVKQIPFAANAGIQFRSKRENNGHAVGYQADIGKGWWGSLYHEHGRKILAKNQDTEGKNLKPEKWNKYEILAVDHRIWLAINGNITVALRDPIGEREGQISLQVHGGMPQKVIYQDLTLERNPQVKMLGMKEAELDKVLKLAPKGFTKLKVK